MALRPGLTTGLPFHVLESKNLLHPKNRSEAALVKQEFPKTKKSMKIAQV